MFACRTYHQPTLGTSCQTTENPRPSFPLWGLFSQKQPFPPPPPPPPVLTNTTILTVQQENSIKKVPYFNCAQTHTNYAAYGKHIKYLYDLLTISLTISHTLQLLPSFIERNGFWNKPHLLRDKSIKSMQGHGLASFLFHHQTTCSSIVEYIWELCCCGPLLLLQLTREREKKKVMKCILLVLMFNSNSMWEHV